MLIIQHKLLSHKLNQVLWRCVQPHWRRQELFYNHNICQRCNQKRLLESNYQDSTCRFVFLHQTFQNKNIGSSKSRLTFSTHSISLYFVLTWTVSGQRLVKAKVSLLRSQPTCFCYFFLKAPVRLRGTWKQENYTITFFDCVSFF